MTDILSGIGIESCAFGTADDALAYLLEALGHCPLVIVDQGLAGQIKGRIYRNGEGQMARRSFDFDIGICNRRRDDSAFNDLSA